MSKKPMYYGDYLKLDTLLNAQSMLSEAEGRPVHDEMMFITTHQVFELWFKQILFELDSVITLFKHSPTESALSLIHSRLNRVTEIQKSLLSQMEVMKTMTPMDFLEFRDLLTPASGFQSIQFRLIETKIGLDRKGNNNFLHSLNDEHRNIIEAAEKSPTLFSSVENWLSTFSTTTDANFWGRFEYAVEDMLKNDQHIISNNPVLTDEKRIQQLARLDSLQDDFSALFDQNKFEQLKSDGMLRLGFDALRNALFIFLYRDTQALHKPYQILSTLITIDELFSSWRYAHALLVGRMIGTKIGTGGSSGLDHLKSTANTQKVFTDIRNLSTFLIPRSALPPLD